MKYTAWHCPCSHSFCTSIFDMALLSVAKLLIPTMQLWTLNQLLKHNDITVCIWHRKSRKGAVSVPCCQASGTACYCPAGWALVLDISLFTLRCSRVRL